MPVTIISMIIVSLSTAKSQPTSKAPALHPGEEMFVDRLRTPVRRKAYSNDFCKGECNAQDRDGIDHRLRQLTPENAVHQKAEEREGRNNPEVLHQFFRGVNFVDVQGRAILEHRQDDRQADRSFGGSDDHHEEREEVSADLLVLVGEGDEAQIDRVPASARCT